MNKISYQERTHFLGKPILQIIAKAVTTESTPWKSIESKKVNYG